MFDHILAKFKGTTALTFKVLGDSPTTQPKPCIDGIQAVIPFNTPVTLPQPFYDVVVGAGYEVVLLEGDASAGEPETEETEETEAAGTDSPPAAPAAPDETLGGGSDASAGGSEEGSGASGADLAPTFDADAIIDGNVATVTERLGSLTDEQLALVKAAEVDREQPRTGVTKAIDALVAERAAKGGEQTGVGA